MLRLAVDPPLRICESTCGVELVVEFKASGIPEIHVEQGAPRPDRHLLLGLAQAAAMAIEEQDRESVAIVDRCSVRLLGGDLDKDLDPVFLAFRTTEGRFAVLAVGDFQTVRRRARDMARYFTGAVRLDVGRRL
jgi:hypothetical protein